VRRIVEPSSIPGGSQSYGRKKLPGQYITAEVGRGNVEMQGKARFKRVRSARQEKSPEADVKSSRSSMFFGDFDDRGFYTRGMG
jgi:hypothetical protein